MTETCPGCYRFGEPHNQFHDDIRFEGTQITDERAAELTRREAKCPRCDQKQNEWAIISVIGRADGECRAIALTCLPCCNELVAS